MKVVVFALLMTVFQLPVADAYQEQIQLTGRINKTTFYRNNVPYDRLTMKYCVRANGSYSRIYAYCNASLDVWTTRIGRVNAYANGWMELRGNAYGQFCSDLDLVTYGNVRMIEWYGQLFCNANLTTIRPQNIIRNFRW